MLATHVEGEREATGTCLCSAPLFCREKLLMAVQPDRSGRLSVAAGRGAKGGSPARSGALARVLGNDRSQRSCWPVQTLHFIFTEYAKLKLESRGCQHAMTAWFDCIVKQIDDSTLNDSCDISNTSRDRTITRAFALSSEGIGAGGPLRLVRGATS